MEPPSFGSPLPPRPLPPCAPATTSCARRSTAASSRLSHAASATSSPPPPFPLPSPLCFAAHHHPPAVPGGPLRRLLDSAEPLGVGGARRSRWPPPSRPAWCLHACGSCKQAGLYRSAGVAPPPQVDAGQPVRLDPPPSRLVPLAPCMMLLGLPLHPRSMQGSRSALPSTCAGEGDRSGGRGSGHRRSTGGMDGG